MLIVKVKGHSAKENIEYLKYNGYGRIIFKLKEDKYICIFGSKNYIELGDVEIKRINHKLLSNYTSQNENEN